MTESDGGPRGNYLAACAAHVASRSEATLEQAYALGRQASAAGLGVLDLAAIHHETLGHLLRDTSSPGERSRVLTAAAEFYAESLAPFEMAQRGFSEATARLREASQQLDAVLQNSPAIISVKDTSYRYTLTNSEFEHFFGRSRHDLVGRTDDDLLPSETVAEVRAADREVLERSAVLQREEVLIHDGQARTLLSIKFPLRDNAGRPYAVCTISTDISDRLAAQALAESRRQEAERQRQEYEAQINQLQRLESVGQLAGGIAHDFNNLLAVIFGYAQLALKHAPDDSRAQQDIQEIYRAAERAAELTRQLLIFSRRDVVRPRTVDLNNLVGGVENMLRRTLGELVELTTSLTDDLWAVEADPGQLEQVLVNLAVNARDAMPRGGQLAIETANVIVDEEFSRMHPSTSPGRYVSVAVSDSGEGMPPEVLQRALEPFYTTKPPGQGTGLGLATVYGIVTSAGGTLTLYSQTGVGTTIKLHLPASDRVAVPAQPLARLQRRGRGEQILVVEDEPELCRITERILTDAGYMVRSASNGEDAMAQLTAGGPVDLLFTDVVMPGTLGPDLARQALAICPGLRVVYTSGYVNQILARQRAIDQHIMLVEKPFTADTLLETIGAALDAAPASLIQSPDSDTAPEAEPAGPTETT